MAIPYPYSAVLLVAALAAAAPIADEAPSGEDTPPDGDPDWVEVSDEDLADLAAAVGEDAAPAGPQRVCESPILRLELINPDSNFREFALFVDVGQPCTVTVETSPNGERWLPATSKAANSMTRSERLALHHLFRLVRVRVELDDPPVEDAPVCVLLVAQTQFKVSSG